MTVGALRSPDQANIIRTWELPKNEQLRVVQKGVGTLVGEVYDLGTNLVVDPDVKIDVTFGDHYIDRRRLIVNGTFDPVSLSERIEAVKDHNLKSPKMLIHRTRAPHLHPRTWYIIQTNPVDKAVRTLIRSWDIPDTNEGIRIVQAGEKDLVGEIFDRDSKQTLEPRANVLYCPEGGESPIVITSSHDVPNLNNYTTLLKGEALNSPTMMVRPQNGSSGLFIIKKKSVESTPTMQGVTVPAIQQSEAKSQSTAVLFPTPLPILPPTLALVPASVPIISPAPVDDDYDGGSVEHVPHVGTFDELTSVEKARANQAINDAIKVADDSIPDLTTEQKIAFAKGIRIKIEAMAMKRDFYEVPAQISIKNNEFHVEPKPSCAEKIVQGTVKGGFFALGAVFPLPAILIAGGLTVTVFAVDHIFEDSCWLNRFFRWAGLR